MLPPPDDDCECVQSFDPGAISEIRLTRVVCTVAVDEARRIWFEIDRGALYHYGGAVSTQSQVLWGGDYNLAWELYEEAQWADELHQDRMDARLRPRLYHYVSLSRSWTFLLQSRGLRVGLGKGQQPGRPAEPHLAALGGHTGAPRGKTPPHEVTTTAPSALTL